MILSLYYPTMKESLLKRTIDKMVKSQKKKAEVVAYMGQNAPHLLWNDYRATRIRECCNVLRFLNYGWWTQKLYTSNFCKYDKLCLACATRRAIKKIQLFEAMILKYWYENKHWYHITLTIRHKQTDTLEQLMDRLIDLRSKISQNIRNCKRPQQSKNTFFWQFNWMVASIEVTHWKSWRHPHIHMLVCGEKKIVTEYSKFLWWESNRELQKEWYWMTKDSYSVAMRKVDVSKNNYDRQGIAEVFKYAVKFTTLNTPQLVELIDLQKRKQYRFYATYGIFRWWKLENNKPLKQLQKAEITNASNIILSDYVFDEKNVLYTHKT